MSLETGIKISAPQGMEKYMKISNLFLIENVSLSRRMCSTLQRNLYRYVNIISSVPFRQTFVVLLWIEGKVTAEVLM
jgi:hypothetical protein